MSEVDIDNYWSSGQAHEDSINAGYIHKDDVIPYLNSLESICMDLLNALQAIKKDMEE